MTQYRIFLGQKCSQKIYLGDSFSSHQASFCESRQYGNQFGDRLTFCESRQYGSESGDRLRQTSCQVEVHEIFQIHTISFPKKSLPLVVFFTLITQLEEVFPMVVFLVNTGNDSSLAVLRKLEEKKSIEINENFTDTLQN